MNLYPAAIATFEQANDYADVAMTRGDMAASQQRGSQLIAPKPTRVLQNRSAVEQRGGNGLSATGAFALEQCAEDSDLKHPRGAVCRVWPSEENRPIAHAVLEMLHPVLRLNQFATHGIIGAALR